MMARSTFSRGVRFLLVAAMCAVASCSPARGGSGADLDAAQPDTSSVDAPNDQATELDARGSDAPTTEVATGDVAAVDAPAFDAPAQDAPTVDATSGDGPAADVSTLDARTTDAVAIDVPVADASLPDASAVDVLAVDVPAVDVPAVDVPAVDVPAVDVATVPCPRSAAGNGQPCADVGEGCGGGLSCGDSYACTCDVTHRWQCVTMASTCDAGRDASGGSDAPSVCALAGDYTLSLIGIGTVYFRLRTDGNWRIAGTFADLDTATSGGDYTATDTELSLRETGTSIAGCTASQVGTYRYTFDSGCASMRLMRVSDPCSLRGTVLNSATLTRR